MTKNKEEAILAGVAVCETNHHMKRRSPWHDYYKKGTYMLTMVVEGRRPLLGRLVYSEEPQKAETSVPTGSATVPAGSSAGTTGSSAGPAAIVELSPLGRAIYEEESRKITEHYPSVEVWKLCIMPDHIHMIIRVKEDLPKGKHLGQVVWGFKVGCTKAWWRLMPTTIPAEEPAGTVAEPAGTVAEPAGTVAEPAGTVAEPAGTVAEPAGKRDSLFESGYNDKILLHEGQLENWKHYLDDNPWRLAIKRLHPNLFTVIHQAVVAGRSCQMVGNRFLLDIPQKMAVIVHKAYTDDEYADWQRKWLACGEAGGVLVSAAIATREKTVMREAMNRGYSIILLRENGFPSLYKPQGESFTACSEGRLLQISPWEYHMQRKTISREQCLMLNRLAEDIANPK